MADEPLQTLFAHIRKPRQHRRAQWEPVQNTGGGSPGMRGSINPLDSVAMTDAAQGVDISSIDPPNRLVAGSIDDEMYTEPTPVDAGEDGGGEKSPFMFASTQGQTKATPVQCEDGMCFRSPQYFDSAAPQMVASTLPEGVSLAPGETYVQGSLRESSGGAAATAPMATAQVAEPHIDDPMSFLARAQQKLQQALPYATSNPVQAVPATMLFNSAQLDTQTGMAALVLKKKGQLAKQLQKLAERGLDQKDEAIKLAKRRMDLESGDARIAMDQGIRDQREKPISWRATQIVRNYADDRGKAGSPMGEKEYADALGREADIITAQDLAWYLGGWLQATGDLAKTKGSGGNAADIAANAELINAKMKQMLVDQFGSIKDPAQRATKMRALLTPVYTDAYKKHLSSDGSEARDSEIQSRAIDEIDTHIAELDEMMAGRASPYDGYYGALRRTSQPEQQAVTPASRPESPPEPAATAPQSGSMGWWDSLSSGPW